MVVARSHRHILDIPNLLVGAARACGSGDAELRWAGFVEKTGEADRPVAVAVGVVDGVDAVSAIERIGAQAALQPVVAVAARQNVVAAEAVEVIFAAVAFEIVVAVVAGDDVVAFAATGVLDVAGKLIRRPTGHVGERDVVGHAVRAGERAGPQIERDAGVVAGQIERVDAAAVPDCELRMCPIDRRRQSW